MNPKTMAPFISDNMHNFMDSNFHIYCIWWCNLMGMIILRIIVACGTVEVVRFVMYGLAYTSYPALLCSVCAHDNSIVI